MGLPLEDSIFSLLIPTNDLTILVLMVATFFVSGIVKGFLGIGLPAAAMGLLTLVVSPSHAISLLVLPIFFTNLSQFLRSQERVQTVTLYWPFAVTIVICIFMTSLFLEKYPVGLLTIAIGVAMVVFALNGLSKFRLKLGPEKYWQIFLGMISGILGGLSSIWSPPVAMYLVARDLEKERFIAATGFLFLIGSVPLALGLFLGGTLNLAVMLQSLTGLIAVLLGFRIGENLRSRVDQKLFQKAVLIAFTIMGVRLIAVGIF